MNTPNIDTNSTSTSTDTDTTTPTRTPTLMKMTPKPVFLGLIAVGATLLAWGLQRCVDGNTAAEAVRKWTMTDIRQLSLGPEMSAVVYDMAVVDKWGWILLYRERWGSLPELVIVIFHFLQ